MQRVSQKTAAEGVRFPPRSTSFTGTGSSIPIPPALVHWLTQCGAKVASGSATTPRDPLGFHYVLATIPLRNLEFSDHRFNPREPEESRVQEIEASVLQLGLVTPLTCAYVPQVSNDPNHREASNESIVLVDGRHRFSALLSLKELPDVGRTWWNSAVQDIKIYYGLSHSEILLLATYLNRTRKNLRKGEYYRVLPSLFNERKCELKRSRNAVLTEREVFTSISAKAVPNKAYDLSIGRLVGIAAFTSTKPDSWYPMVGTHQRQVFRDPTKGYCPITAGNLAVLLGELCFAGPYTDDGGRRVVELENVFHLGRLFREQILVPVPSYERTSATIVCCKHWCMQALGKVIRGSRLSQAVLQAGLSPFSSKELDWGVMRRVVRAYFDIMRGQADIVNRIRESQKDDSELLRRAWSYQTQTGQIVPPLRDALNDIVPELAARTHGHSVKGSLRHSQ